MPFLSRRFLPALAALGALLGCAAPALAYQERSVGSAEQIAWVRRAAGNFLAAELGGDGGGACGVLIARLRASEHHRTCQQRWDAHLRTMLHQPGERARLRSEQRAVASAAVRVHGNSASIELPAPLMGGSNRFVWTENCWMLAS